MMNAITPGVFIETVAGERKKSLGVSGVVTMPLELDWGDTVITLNRGENTIVKLGYRLKDIQLKLVNEVMNYADKLIVYRLNSGNKATAILATNVTAEALYGGVRGNDIKVIVTASGDSFIIKTFIGTDEIDKQIVKTVAEFKQNSFIKITGTGTLEAKTAVLSGGTNKAPTATALDEYFAEIEKHEYNVMAYTDKVALNIQKVVDFIIEQRKKNILVSCVISGVATDKVGIINSTIGGKTANYELTANEACATMAGIQAKCGVERTATYYSVIGWIDVVPRLNQIELETKTQAGETLFVLKHGEIIVLYDINSLTTYTNVAPKDFSKNLVVRTLDKYATDLQALLDLKAIGKIRNSTEGRSQIKGMIATMTVNDYLNHGYIEGFTASDVAVLEATDRDSITVTVAIKIVDTVDKIYITVTAI